LNYLKVTILFEKEILNGPPTYIGFDNFVIKLVEKIPSHTSNTISTSSISTFTTTSTSTPSSIYIHFLNLVIFLILMKNQQN
jgi:hypothetical protein